MVVVLSMLRLMLFRMQKDFTFVLFAFFIIVIAVFFPLFAGLSKVFPLNIVVIKAPADASVFDLIGMTSGVVSLWWCGVALAALFAADFKKGSIKNYLQARGGRTSWALAAAASTLIASATCALVVYAVSDVGFRLAGYDMAPTNPLDAVRWVVQTAVTLSGYVAVATLAVTITRSEAVGVFAAVLLIGGAVEQVLLGLCSLALSPGAAEGLYAHMPIADMSVLQGGPLPWGSCIEGVVLFVCASALVALVMRRRKL